MIPYPSFSFWNINQGDIKHVFRAQLRGRGNIHEDPSFGMNENFAKGSTGCRWGVSFEEPILSKNNYIVGYSHSQKRFSSITLQIFLLTDKAVTNSI